MTFPWILYCCGGSLYCSYCRQPLAETFRLLNRCKRSGRAYRIPSHPSGLVVQRSVDRVEEASVCAAASLASSKDAKGAAALTAIRQGAAPGARLVPARRIRNVPGLAPVARAIAHVAVVFR